MELASLRAQLGMTHDDVARRSGVSVPTVKRILGGQLAQASFGHVAAVAAALGAPIGLEPTDPEELCRVQARAKAEAIARLVQGTSGLEGQGLDSAEFARLVERSYHELLAGPRRRLWAP